MRLTSYLGKNKAPIAELFIVIFELFQDVTKNPSKADDSRSKNMVLMLDAMNT